MFLLLGALVACAEESATPNIAPIIDVPPSPLDPELVDGGAGDLDAALYFVEERPWPYQRIHTAQPGADGLSATFQVEDGAFLTDLAVDPVNGTLALTYIPPPGDLATGYDTVGLFSLAPGDAQPRVLVWPEEGVVLGHPTWALDGASIYFVRSEPEAALPLRLQRYTLADGSLEDVALNATTPALAPDGRSLAYVWVQPGADVGGLFVERDGQLSRLIEPGMFHGIENVLFGPQGNYIYFTVPRVTAVEVTEGEEGTFKHGASHGSASDWWRASVPDGDLMEVAPVGLDVHSAAVTRATPASLYFSTPTGVYSVPCESKGAPEPVAVIQSRAIRQLAFGR